MAAPDSRMSAPSAPSASVLVSASYGGADGIGGADASAPRPVSAPAGSASACGVGGGADGALVRVPGTYRVHASARLAAKYPFSRAPSSPRGRLSDLMP